MNYNFRENHRLFELEGIQGSLSLPPDLYEWMTFWVIYFKIHN